MSLITIWKVIWFATPQSDSTTYYFKDDKNIEPTLSLHTPPYPISSYTKEQIEVLYDSPEYRLCID